MIPPIPDIEDRRARLTAPRVGVTDVKALGSDDEVLDALANRNPVAPFDFGADQGDRIWAVVNDRIGSVHAATPAAPSPRPFRWRPLAAVSTAFVVLVITVTVGGTPKTTSTADNTSAAAGRSATPIIVASDVPAGSPAPAVTPGPRANASCVVVYRLDQLAAQAPSLVFDGVVSAVGPTWVEFKVKELFRGVAGESVRLTSPFGFSAGTEEFDELPQALIVGRRYLVGAADGHVWGCGFTQAYSESLAADWRQALNN
jgi:hypothetical protein